MDRSHFRCTRFPSALLLLAVSGCAATTPILDRNFGAAVGMINAQQTLNPRAALNRDPVVGMDGKAATSAYDEYQKSFKVPAPQPNAFTIGIGGAR